MDAEGWKKHMGDLEIGAFAEGGTNTGFFMDEESGRSWTQSLKSMTVDWNGYQHLNRSLKTGRELEKGILYGTAGMRLSLLCWELIMQDISRPVTG